MTIIETFKTIRDIPYRIPLTLNEEDKCCDGKHIMLKNLLEELGLKVRYRVCSFLWSSVNLPNEVLNIFHDNLSSHVWLEVLINDKWLIIDATWDIGIKNIFPINEWDGKSNTKIAVNPLKLYTPQESARIMNNSNDEEIILDLKRNKSFYKAFNDWLAVQRTFTSKKKSL